MNLETGGGTGRTAESAGALLAPALAVVREEAGRIEHVASRLADILQSGRQVYAFGAGHSKTPADELCSRAGGLVGFTSMNLDDLRTEPRPAHQQLSDSIPERIPENGPALLELYGVRAGDGLLIASQSGRNGAPVEMALTARARGVYVVAITSCEHSRAVPSRHPDGIRLLDVVDDVIDNHGHVGDAAIGLGNGSMVGATSTISGALIAQLLAVTTAQTLEQRGVDPRVIRSANLDDSGLGNP